MHVRLWTGTPRQLLHLLPAALCTKRRIKQSIPADLWSVSSGVTLCVSPHSVRLGSTESGHLRRNRVWVRGRPTSKGHETAQAQASPNATERPETPLVYVSHVSSKSVRDICSVLAKQNKNKNKNWVGLGSVGSAPELPSSRPA